MSSITHSTGPRGTLVLVIRTLPTPLLGSVTSLVEHDGKCVMVKYDSFLLAHVLLDHGGGSR